MSLPRHIAIIMDGNGRWARSRGEPRSAGHKAGMAPVRTCIEECARRRIEALTLFAFSSENWKRPPAEVSALMTLFMDAIDAEVRALHDNGVRIRFVGDRLALPVRLQSRMLQAEALTANNGGLKLQLAVAYGGRWDIVNASQLVARLCSEGALTVAAITEDVFAAGLQLAGIPEPDLFIRTGGEHRISNFLLWDLAYTELYFSELLWPDFDVRELERALARFAARERRYGLTAEQLAARVSG